MKLLMTYSKRIKTFEDISRHLELKAERIETFHSTYVAYSGSSRLKSRKRGKVGDRSAQGFREVAKPRKGQSKGQEKFSKD